MKNIIIVFIGFVFIFFFNFCVEEKRTNKIEEIRFNVDTTILGDKVILNDLNITINPPKNWNLIAPDASQTLLNNYKFQSDYFVLILQPQNIFIDSITNSMMFISKIIDKIKLGKEKLISDYSGQIKNQFAGSNVMVNDFFKEKFNVTQFLIQNKNIINFKLLINYRDSFIQLDYLIPPSEYNTEIAKAIESSIGSMNVFNNKLKSEDL